MTEHTEGAPARAAEPVLGLLLAAGAGSRMGQPKALVDTGQGPWVARGALLLKGAGCSAVVVVVGARASEVERVLATELGDADVITVRAEDWATGMAASLRAGLQAASAVGAAHGVLITLVDLPDVRPAALDRVLEEALGSGRAAGALVQATYEGHPGHPVYIGREHWSAVAESVSGDSGARRYLAAHAATRVACDDLGGGDDVDAF